MPTSPRSPSEALFREVDGERVDADIHDEILAEGNHAAARESSDALARSILTPEQYALWAVASEVPDDVDAYDDLI
jgi:hypothetical protein